MTDEEPELKAKGVTSQVEVDGEVTGHVTLADWDDWEPTDREVDLMDDMPGVSILTKSSDGSKHFWNLSVKGLDEVALKLLRLKSDPMRTMLGYRWRPPRWVTRITAKTFEDGTEEKGPPELIAIRVNETSIPQSKAHWAIANTYIEGMPEEGTAELPIDLNWTDGRCRVEEYRAYSEAQKDGG